MKILTSINQNNEDFNLKELPTIKDVLKIAKNKKQFKNKIEKDVDCEDKTQEKQMSENILEKLKDGIDSLFSNLSKVDEVLEEAVDKEVETQEESKKEEATEEIADEAKEDVAEENKEPAETQEESAEESDEEPEPEVEEKDEKVDEMLKEEIDAEKNVSKTVDGIESKNVVSNELVKAKDEKINALQKQVDEMKKAKEEELIKSQKAELVAKAKKELSFANGTPEENAEKLFMLKTAIGEEKAELFDFVLDGLKKQSQEVEKSLDQDGVDVSGGDLEVLDTATAKLEKIAKEIATKEGISEAKAYRKACNENVELFDEARKEAR